ncbi:MAG: serine hydrolase [Elusimicrobiota bacterium]
MSRIKNTPSACACASADTPFRKRGINKYVKFLILFLFLFASLLCYGEYVVLNRKKVYNYLMNDVSELARNFHGEVGIYIKDLRTGIVVSYDAEKLFPSASLVKIPIMASVWQAVEDGNINFGDKIKLTRGLKTSGAGKLKRARRGTKYSVRELTVRMITESDNTATNMLTATLGRGYINWVFRNRFEFEVTNFSRNIMDLNASKSGIENYTNAREMGVFLEKIYRGRVVSRAASKDMLEILTNQRIKDRIPRFLPKDLIVANKTGLLKDICHDAGIVFTPRGDFIVCVLTSDFRRYRYAKTFIGEIAYKTYRCY